MGLELAMRTEIPVMPKGLEHRKIRYYYFAFTYRFSYREERLGEACAREMLKT